jgi:hypothetical protein
VDLFPKYRSFFPHMMTSSIPPLSFISTSCNESQSGVPFGGWTIKEEQILTDFKTATEVTENFGKLQV